MAYRITGRKTGTVKFQPATGTITQETMTKSSKMTSNAIEGGSTIEDHVSLNPEQLQIAGLVVRNCGSYKSQLESMWRNRDLVTYVGKFRVTDYVIINLQLKNLSSNKKGFAFTATLQKANIVSGQYVELGQALLMSQQDKGEKSKGTGQAEAIKAAGLKTKVSEQISQSSYASYVNSYNGKSSTGPNQRKTTSFNGV